MADNRSATVIQKKQAESLANKIPEAAIQKQGIVKPTLQLKGKVNNIEEAMADKQVPRSALQLKSIETVQFNRNKNKQSLASQKYNAKMQKGQNKQQQKFERKQQKRKPKRDRAFKPAHMPEFRGTDIPEFNPKATHSQQPGRSGGRGSSAAKLKWYHYLLLLLMLSSMVTSAAAMPTGRRGRNHTGLTSFEDPFSENMHGYPLTGNTNSSLVIPGHKGSLPTSSSFAFGHSALNQTHLHDEQFRIRERGKIEKQLRLLSKRPLDSSVMRDKDASKLQLEQLGNMSVSNYKNKAVTPVDPSAGKGHIVGVVGLPGSGKSTLQRGFEESGYEVRDDIGRRWEDLDQGHNSVKSLSQKGKNVVMSDIEFTRSEMREQTEQRVERPVDWAYFENNPEMAKENAKYRKENAETDYDKARDLAVEHEKVERLSGSYDLPTGVATHPIVNATRANLNKPKPKSK